MNAHIETAILGMINEPEEEVFIKIGKLDPDRLALGAEDVKRFIGVGQQWWARHEPSLKSMICGNPEFKNAVSSDVRDLITLVFQLLSLQYGEAMAVYVSSLVVKRLLSGWCEARE